MELAKCGLCGSDSEYRTDNMGTLVSCRRSDNCGSLKVLYPPDKPVAEIVVNWKFKQYQINQNIIKGASEEELPYIKGSVEGPGEFEACLDKVAEKITLHPDFSVEKVKNGYILREGTFDQGRVEGMWVFNSAQDLGDFIKLYA